MIEFEQEDTTMHQRDVMERDVMLRWLIAALCRYQIYFSAKIQYVSRIYAQSLITIV